MHFVDWRRGVCLLQMVMALGWGLKAPSASACSPPYPGPWFFTLGDSIPEDGAADVLPEGFIQLSRQSWAAPGTEAKSPDELRHEVTVIDLETGAEVKGSLGSGEWSNFNVRYWKPESPLLPNRRYALLQSLTQSVSRPDTAQGPTQTRTSFSTGNRRLLPLNVYDRLEARVESYQANLCNGAPMRPCDGCVVPVHESRHGVWIQVHPIQGGFTFGTYQIEVVVTQNTPHDFSKPASAERPVLLSQNFFSTGDSTVGFLELPLKASTAARPCVAWRVLDSLKNVREGTPVCLDATPPPVGEEPGQKPGDKPTDSPGYLGFGCSLGGAGLGPAALALLALWARRRPHGRR